MSHRKRWTKGIASSYMVVTRVNDHETVKQWLNQRPIVTSKHLAVTTLQRLSADNNWTYQNARGKTYSIGHPKRRKFYYYASFGPDKQYVASEGQERIKQLRLQREYVQIHFKNNDGYAVFPAEMFEDQREFLYEEDEEVQDPGPQKKLKFTMNTPKKQLLEVLFVVIEQRNELQKELDKIKQEISNVRRRR